MSFISLTNVDFCYPNGFQALDNINIEIEQGENIAIIGQNGAGKTTTVKLMNGLIRPTSGNVVIDGMNTQNYTTAQVARKVGYVFQNPDEQIFHNTVMEEIEFGPKIMKYDERCKSKLVEKALALTELEKYKDENPYNLPLSIRKIVTIASVIAMNPDVLIYDEPTAGQDLHGIRILENILKELQKEGKTQITITHDMEFVAKNFEKVIVMAHKNVLLTDEPREVFWQSDILEESMLKQPYISAVAKELGISQKILFAEELVEVLKAEGISYGKE